MTDRPIRVAVVDDHPAIAVAIQAVVEGAAFEFAGAARSVVEARALLDGSAGQVDVVMCDVQLQSGLDGLEVIDLARAAGARAIVFTSFDRSSLMRAAFERGASGFLDKGAEAGAIRAAIEAVAAGGTAFSAAALESARFGPRPPSSREIAVLEGLRAGSSSDEIGRELGISTRTVESHLRRMFDRYGVVSRTELALLAVDQGWISASR